MRRIRIVQALGSCLSLVASMAMVAEAQENGGVGGTPSIQWLTSDQEAADKSTREGKPVLIRITATWCRPCQQMKQLTFTDSRVVRLVEGNFIPLLIDADAHPDLVALYKVEAYPTTLVMGADKSVLKKLTGFQSGDSLVTALLPLAKVVPKTDGPNSSGDLTSAMEPENGVKMAFDGYCLVSLLEDSKARKGSADFAAEYRGQTVCFTSAEQRQKFLQAPDKYWPVANGKCLVSSRDGLLAGVGDPRMAVTWRGRIWLFSDRARQRRFIQAPKYYAGEM